MSETSADHRKLALPLSIPFVVVCLMMTIGMCRRDQQLTALSVPVIHKPRIFTGTATELAPAIRAAPRAVVFVGSPASVYAYFSRKAFPVAAEEIAANGAHPDIWFFVIENEWDDDSVTWAETFQDERLVSFGYLGYGWVMWLERGQLIDVDPYSGTDKRTLPGNIVVHTQKLWP